VSILTVQLFASYAELFGGPIIQVPFETGGTVADLVHSIRSMPAGRSLPATPRIAVNRKFAPPTQLLSNSDEIAVIPPVAGG